jgi:hypothetical protein
MGYDTSHHTAGKVSSTALVPSSQRSTAMSDRVALETDLAHQPLLDCANIAYPAASTESLLYALSGSEI